MIEDGMQQLLFNSYQKRDPISSKLMTMSYTKTKEHLKPYTPKEKVQQQELSKIDNNQSVNINQRPKHNIRAPNRLNLL